MYKIEENLVYYQLFYVARLKRQEEQDHGEGGRTARGKGSLTLHPARSTSSPAGRGGFHSNSIHPASQN